MIQMKPLLDTPTVDRGCLLIVDDERFVLNALTRLLRRDQHDIVTVEAPTKALDVLRERPVGVIVSDYRMPEMDGVQFLRQAREVAPEAIRIILSGYAEIHAILSAVNDGGIHKYLTKPWNDEQLRLEVKAGFDQYVLAKTNRLLQETLQCRNEELLALTSSLESEQARQQENFRATIEMLVAVPKMKHPDEVVHTERVLAICRAMGETLGWVPEDIESLGLAARLHDIGNLGVDSRILLKEDGLSAAERSAVQQHTVYPGKILHGVTGMEEIVRILHSHHENFDGSGYPDGLKGDAIPRASQILYIADAYDALRLQRPYRSPLTPEEAVALITHAAARSFDPALMEPFRSVMSAVEPLGRSERGG
jgi:response regulator RpfG family c-di-GMP phosphodiesterase